VPHLPVVVVGAGHSGLAMSRRLVERSIDHVVLERGEVAHSWRTQRWDSLRLLTPNWLTRLPGYAYDGPDPDGYLTAAEVVGVIEKYAVGAPVLSRTAVHSVRHGQRYTVEAQPGRWTADAVVVASGACAVAKVPALADALPAGIVSLTPDGYRNPAQLPEGEVLVVGASSSGVQIADELLRSGRSVSLAVGEHVRLPRRYRGRDILWWMEHAGVLDERYDAIDDLVRARSLPSMQLAASGTLDLNTLVARGARLHGKLLAIRDGRALFSGGLRNVCALADLKLSRLLDSLDTWAGEAGLDAPAPERFAPTTVPDSPTLELDLGSFSAVVWATGFRPDLSWLAVPVHNARGWLLHDGGVTRAPGLYLLGMPLLRRRKSTLIDGAGPDTAEIAEHLAGHLDALARR